MCLEKMSEYKGSEKRNHQWGLANDLVFHSMFLKLLSVSAFLLAFGGATYPQLKLETKIVSQYYCRGDDDLDGLTLKLRLKYSNTGNRTIILSKDSVEVWQTKVLINNMGVPGETELNSSLEWISSGEWKARPSDLARLFVLLKPGGKYKTRTQVRVFVFREGRTGIAGAIGNGEHFLQLRVLT